MTALTNQSLPYVFFYAIIFLVGVFCCILLFIYKSGRKIHRAELEKKNMEITMQHKLIEAALAAQEDERRRIAQDLHDEVSTKITAANLNLYLLKNPKTDSQNIENIVNNLMAINTNIAETARRISHDLMPPILEQYGLHEAIYEVVSNLNKTHKLLVTYTNHSDFGKLPVNTQLNLYRIVQELINNSIKHGNATAIHINFKEQDTYIIASYTDNGKGLPQEVSTLKKGLGLFTIENRIRSIKGEMITTEVPEKGFAFSFKFGT